MHLFDKRVEKLRRYMEEKRIAAVVLTNPENQYYFTNFLTVSYSRPIITFITQDSIAMIIPSLEREHAKMDAHIDALYTYGEVPGSSEEPYSILKRLLSPIEGGVGVERKFMPLSVAEILDGKEIRDVGARIEEMRMIKDEMELRLIRSAAYLVDFGVKSSLQAAGEGVAEIEIDDAGNREILKKASTEFPGYMVSLFSMSPSGKVRTPMPHVFSTGRRIIRGDVVIHSRQVALNGYRAECERTFFISPIKKEYCDAFQAMVEAQREAMRRIKDGVRAGEVDMAAREVIEEYGYGKYFPHRTGHGIGIGVHEPPYLRFDSQTILRKGMVVTVEPGIYIPGLGGFRHSDTIIVDESGGELLTHFPRDMDSLII